MSIKIILSNKGQAQLLGAMVIGIVILSAGMYVVERNQRAAEFQIKSNFRSEMRTAIDGATKTVAHLYHNEANCDPVTLTNLINKIDKDGNVIDEIGTRQISYIVNERTYSISIGAVQRISWEGVEDDPSMPWKIGTSQDALIELWTSHNNQRVVQAAALLNTCTYPCSSTIKNNDGSVDQTNGICQVASDQAIAFHTLDDPSVFSKETCDGGLRNKGDLNDVNASLGTAECPKNQTDSTIDVIDLMIFKNYLRTGRPNGSCETSILASNECTDLNNDGITNETDLNLLEKTLRGYIYLLPIDHEL
mgnify:CR=1 FL=1